MNKLDVENIELDPKDLFDVDEDKVKQENDSNDKNLIPAEDLFNLEDGDKINLKKAGISTNNDDDDEDDEDDEYNDDYDGDDDDDNDEENHNQKSSRKSQNNENNVYQGLLKSLIEDGVFSEEDDEVVDADSFKEYINKQVTQQLGDYQSDLKRALDVGADLDEIRLYNQAMNWLSSYNDEVLNGSDQKSKQARVNLIYRDYLNKGFKPEKAKSLTMASAKVGSDIKDAREALESCRDYFVGRYNDAVQKAEEIEEDRQQYILEQEKEIKKNIYEKNTLFGKNVTIDKNIRKKAYDVIAKPYIKDDGGRILSELQYYSQENPVEFKTIMGLMYAMTDGFKNFNKVFNSAVDKKVNSRLDEFTKKITSQPHSDGGSLSYKNGRVKELFDAGWKPLV